MSLISQTTSYTTPGTYTYTIPQGVGSLEFHIWGAGGADGDNGKSISVQSGSTSSQIQSGTTQTQTGTTQVETGVAQIQTGTTQVQTGTAQEAYTVSTTCFPAGTLVSTPTGLVAIESLLVGDLVYGFDIHQDSSTINYAAELVASPITKLYIHTWAEADEFSYLLVITHEHGVLTITAGHEVLSSSRDATGPFEGFVRAEHLTVGDVIYTTDGTPSIIQEIVLGDEYDLVYNLEIDGVHTYIADGIRVHNGILVGSGGNGGGKGKGSTTRTLYRTVPIYETVPTYTTVSTYTAVPVYTTNPVYTTVSTPVYSSVTGGRGGHGAPGGYASRKVQVHAGDVVVISIGAPGLRYAGGISQSVYFQHHGGDSGQSSEGGRGGGGGGATVVTVNGVIVGIAAGGGGGGGAGISNHDGDDGITATVSGIGSGDSGPGKISVNGPATGGGGGGGFYGGHGGASGDVGKGGEGGVCYGTIIEGGHGVYPTWYPGGRNLEHYPGHNYGYAAQSGAAVLIFNKSFNINVKRSSKWNPVNSAFVKVNSHWKEISNGWTKVSGEWVPLISSDAVTGADNILTPAITYSLTADSASIAEADTVTFTLATTGIASGTIIPYTVSGIDADDVATNQHLTGHFVVGTTDTITFTPRLDHTTKGTRILKVSLDNTTESAECTILDTSITPVYTIYGNISSVNEGGAVRFTMSNVGGIAGESINYAITGINGSRISSGLINGTFVVGSVETKDFAIANDYTTTGPTVMTITLLGKGASTTCTINDTSTTPHGSLTGTTSGTTWTVPAGVYSAVVNAIGGGGGGGQDSHAGYNGYAGDKITGTISVTPGQVYTLYSGTGGGAGASDQGSAAGGVGGIGLAAGGAGSAAGPTPISGGGGGGGAGSALLFNGIPVLVAAGGGGGGGGGNGSTGQPQQNEYASTSNGGNGTAKGGDGGGAGGGGSGYPLGGAGGALLSGDNGGYSGNNGQRVIPSGCTVASAYNGGGAASRGGTASTAGGNGSITVSW